MIEYRRAYYFSKQARRRRILSAGREAGNRQKRHTPGCQYFLASFTGREAYEKSLERFHEIFRPDGTELISLRKSLDMDAQLGSRLESLRQEEIGQVYEKKAAREHRTIRSKELMAVSVDATKLRQWGRSRRTAEGQKSYPTIWRDVKIGAVSSIGWDEKRRKRSARASSYVSGIEHADLFFKRLTVEMQRRAADLKGHEGGVPC